MFTLTSFTAPFASFTTFSSAGPSCLHGPHHGAQKSTMTGTSREASSTSAAKVSMELSLIWGPEAPDAEDAAAPEPLGLPSASLLGSRGLAGAAMGRPDGSIRGMSVFLPTGKMVWPAPKEKGRARH